MSANDLLGLFVQLLFILLGVATVTDYLRRRDRIRRDIALMFSALATLFLFQVFEGVSQVESRLLGLLGLMALISQPFLLLRLVRYFHPVSATVMRLAAIGLVIAWVGFILAEAFTALGATIALIAIIIYFVALDGYSAVIFVRGALTTSGVVRQRLRFAATGSALLALALLSLGLIAVFPALRDFLSFVTLLSAAWSALAYHIGFAPPRWLRRSWQFVELHNFLLSVNARAVHNHHTTSRSLGELSQAANRAVGGIATVVLQADAANESSLQQTICIPSDFPKIHLASDSIIRQSWQERRPASIQISSKLRDGDYTLLKIVGADTLLIVPVATMQRVWGLVLVFLKHESLFIEDDLDLLALLAQQSAIFLENSHLIEELHQHSEELERRVEERTQELKESREQYRQIVETAQEGIWLTDAENKTVFANARLAEMLGSTIEELIAKPASDFLDDEGKAASVQYRERRLQGIKEQYEFRFRHKNGHDLWTLISSTPLLDDKGQYAGALAMLADITERKEAEAHILNLNAELEQRVIERTQQLELANKELEAFSYSVSHDLRAPLRSINGFSLALLEDHAEQLPEEGQSYINRIRNATQRMTELIDDLLDLSRITRVPIQRDTVDLSNICRTIVSGLQKSNPERLVEFVSPDKLTVDADPKLLRIVLENLLGNAWKFTSKVDLARIEVGATTQMGHTAYFVQDNGAGFDMTYADKLFGAFQRLHGPTEFEGTGIGLATVQRIIHRHGGRVWAEGQVGHGATFYFSL